MRHVTSTGRIRKCSQNLSEYLNGRGHLEVVAVGGRIILKWILK
jgi:hypothetical protein